MSDPYRDSVRQMDREVYERLVNSLATGRWSDGRALTEEQRQNAMRAVIIWGELHLPAEARVGFIDRGHKADEVCDEPEPIAWKESQHE